MTTSRNNVGLLVYVTLNKADPTINPVHLVFKVTLLICAAVAGLTLACSIPLQNHCIDGEGGSWSCGASC